MGAGNGRSHQTACRHDRRRRVPDLPQRARRGGHARPGHRPRAELADRHKIRPLIKKHAAELGRFPRAKRKPRPPADAPALPTTLPGRANPFIAAKCRTKAAAAQLKRLIAVYMAARAGNGAAAVAMAQGTAEPRVSGGLEEDRLIAVIETQLQLARANQRMKAELAQVAAQQTELAKQQTMQAVKVDRILAAQQAAEVEAQRPITSQIPLLPVFDVAQHEALRTIRAHGFANGGRYQGSFNRVYDLYKSMYHEDLKVRAKNRGISPAELVTEMGIWDRLLAIAVKHLRQRQTASTPSGAWGRTMPNHSIGWAANRRAVRRARYQLAAQLFIVFLSIVGLWASWCIGCDFIDHMPGQDMGAW